MKTKKEEPHPDAVQVAEDFHKRKDSVLEQAADISEELSDALKADYVSKGRPIPETWKVLVGLLYEGKEEVKKEVKKSSKTGKK